METIEIIYILFSNFHVTIYLNKSSRIWNSSNQNVTEVKFWTINKVLLQTNKLDHTR